MSEPSPRLDAISTRWSSIGDPSHFTLRYAGAIQQYLEALLPDPNDADEVLQGFLLRVVEHGFESADPGKGRFRDYLRRAARNAAISHLRRRRPATLAEGDLPADTGADRRWLEEWRACVLERAWEALGRHQRRHPESRCHTVLRLVTEHPRDDSRTLAKRAAEATGGELTAEAFRKQLSRARRLFAEILVRETAETLDRPTPGDVEEELADLGLMGYVGSWLPEDWRTRPLFARPD